MDGPLYGYKWQEFTIFLNLNSIINEFLFAIVNILVMYPSDSRWFNLVILTSCSSNEWQMLLLDSNLYIVKFIKKL